MKITHRKCTSVDRCRFHLIISLQIYSHFKKIMQLGRPNVKQFLQILRKVMSISKNLVYFIKTFLSFCSNFENFPLQNFNRCCTIVFYTSLLNQLRHFYNYCNGISPTFCRNRILSFSKMK